MIPGRMLHRLAALMCAARSLERIVEPAIADLQKEYATTTAHRAAVLLRGYVAVLRVVAICALDVSDATNADRRAVTRTLTWALSLAIVMTTLFTIPPLLDHPDAMGWYAAMTVVPQALPLAIPIGLGFAIAFGLSARVTMSAAKVMLLAAFAASLLSFATFAWGIPAGSQAFQEMTLRALRARGYDAPVSLQKGLSELTLSELRTAERDAALRGQPRTERMYARAFHFRFALASAALALTGFLLVAPVDRRLFRGLLAFGACLVYWALIFTGEFATRRYSLTPFLGAWLPNIAFATIAVILTSSRSPRLRVL